MINRDFACVRPFATQIANYMQSNFTLFYLLFYI